MPCALENEHLMRTQWLKIMKLSHLNFCAKIVILVNSIVIFFNYVKMRLFEAFSNTVIELSIDLKVLLRKRII